MLRIYGRASSRTENVALEERRAGMYVSLETYTHCVRPNDKLTLTLVPLLVLLVIFREIQLLVYNFALLTYKIVAIASMRKSRVALISTIEEYAICHRGIISMYSRLEDNVVVQLSRCAMEDVVRD